MFLPDLELTPWHWPWLSCIFGPVNISVYLLCQALLSQPRDIEVGILRSVSRMGQGGGKVNSSYGVMSKCYNGGRGDGGSLPWGGINLLGGGVPSEAFHPWFPEVFNESAWRRGESSLQRHLGRLSIGCVSMPRPLHWIGARPPCPPIPSGWCCFRDTTADGHSFTKVVEA